MTRNDEDRDMVRLRQVLAAYGADPSRWPPGDRRLGRLLVDAPSARAGLREERAVDAMLAAGARASATPPAALLERIVSSAQTRPVPVRDNVVPFRPRAESPEPAVTANPGRRMWVNAGALLAACLLAGVFLGQSASLTPLMQGVAEQLGLQESETMLAIALDPTIDDGAL